MKRLLSFSLVLLLVLSACAKTGGPPSGPAESGAEPPLTEPSGNTAPEGPRNPLTGLRDGISEENARRKPVAIMINNIRASLPQYGIGGADIIYEMLAEGSITRLLAIWKDPSKAARIGSIRSARPYYMEIADGYDAIYLHFGGSVPAYQKIAKHEIINLDGIENRWDGLLYYREAERRKKYAREHTVFTTGERIESALALLSNDLTVKDRGDAFDFSTEPSSKDGMPADKITVHYSKNYNPWFEYDEQSKAYLHYEYGDPHIDGETGRQLSVKNVFVLKMKTSAVKGSKLGLIEIETAGKGRGFYACEGKYIPVNWEKKDAASPIRFSLEDGAGLKVSPGNTYVCCIPQNSEPEFE
ncbi:MAG: DUF3048 domain-containing protein [Bacillota bacterium]|nr:DUF3048 domain-containing protein [Bacillota bacterium]